MILLKIYNISKTDASFVQNHGKINVLISLFVGIANQ
jgi:hypothetical protein